MNEYEPSIPLSVHNAEISKLNQRISYLEGVITMLSAKKVITEFNQIGERAFDEDRRKLVMAAAEDLRAQGLDLAPLPDPRYSDLEGMNVSTLATYRDQLHIGSVAWIIRHAKDGDIPSYILRGERWFDALDIKEVQHYATSFKRLGYTRRRRKPTFSLPSNA